MLSRIGYIKVFIKDPDKKNMGRLVKELIRYAWIKKTLPSDYFRKFLYRKEVDNYLDYLSLKEHNKILDSKKLVFPEISALLNNKLSFKGICKNENIPTATLLGYNLKNNFVTNGVIETIHQTESLVHFFEKLINQAPNKRLFLKPIQGIGGFGCLVLNPTNLIEQLNRYSRVLLKTSYIHETYIEQHSVINQIHPHAINTLRMVHYIDNQNNVHLLSTFMRFGVGISITDNTSGGGFSIAVNKDTGVLEGVGRQEITRGGSVFVKHPDTDFKLEGFQIPYFKEACLLVKHVAPYFPNRIVGWDIAITPNGPIVLEGNHNPGLHVSDMAYGGFLKHPLVNDLLNEINTP